MVRTGLVGLYNTIHGHEELLRGVEIGEHLFLQDLKEVGVDSKTQYNLSRVHPYGDVKVQAFGLAIPSIGNPPEIVAKSYMTYVAHWVDDYFDRSNFQDEVLSQMRMNSLDLDCMIRIMGKVGAVCERMITRGKHKVGISKGLHRMIYGGLIIGAPDPLSQERYLKEHMSVSLSDVEGRVSNQIREKISPVAFWMTTKTVQELLLGCEAQYNPTLAMLYDLLYAPTLYYHDADEEEREGELNFYDGKKPSQEEALNMIDLFGQNINSITDGRFNLRTEQLKFLLQAFRHRLPPDIGERYDDVLNVLKVT